MRLMAGIGGVLFAVAAATLGLFYPSKSLTIALLSSVALLLLVFFLVAHFEALKAFSKKRSTQLGLNSTLMAVFFIFAVVMVNLIISQFYFRKDLSATGKFTLSKQTENVLRGVEDEVTVLAFLQGEGKEAAFIREMLEGYRYINHRLLYSVYDLDTVPAIAQRYGVDKYNTAVILSGDKSVKVDSVDEEAVTNGIIRITRKEHKVVYFLEGHGERGIKEAERGGAKTAADSLMAIGYEVRTVNLAAVGTVPADAAAVVVAGPKAKISDSEVQALKNYAREGSLLLMLDFEGEKMEDLVSGLLGLRFLNGLVSEPEKRLAGSDDTVVLVDSYPPSPVTEDFTLTTVFPTTFGFLDSGTSLEHEYQPLVKTSEKSRTVFEGSEGKKEPNEGPTTIAMLVKSKASRGRTIVFGDSDFVTNEYVGVYGNGNLFRNAVSFLVGETDLVSIEPRKAEFVPLYITDAQADVLKYAFMAGPPLLIAAVGTALWVRRRKL